MKSFAISALAAVAIAFGGTTAVSAQVQLHELLFKPKSERDQYLQENRRTSYRASNKSPIRRKVINFDGYSVGTIVIDTSDRRLYHVIKPGKAIFYQGAVKKHVQKSGFKKSDAGAYPVPAFIVAHAYHFAFAHAHQVVDQPGLFLVLVPNDHHAYLAFTGLCRVRRRHTRDVFDLAL